MLSDDANFIWNEKELNGKRCYFQTAHTHKHRHTNEDKFGNADGCDNDDDNDNGVCRSQIINEKNINSKWISLLQYLNYALVNPF